MRICNYENNVPNGFWKEWYENGKPKDSGRKYYNKMVGSWKFWHDNGQLLTNSKYADSFSTPPALTKYIKKENIATEISNYLELFFEDVKIGTWILYFDNGQMQDSLHYNIDGKIGFAKSWYKNGNLESSGTYLKGLRENTWTWYYENGITATVEMYKNGKIVSLNCFDSTGKYVSDYCSINKPAMFPGGITKFEEYIKKNVKYPEDAMQFKHEAIVRCTFRIDKNGKVNNVKFSESPIIYFNREIENALYAMPTWEPAIMHNRLADYDVQLSVPFYLPK
jgi:antitoxin component YwqK of YwqJK toxin-antitoxin module